MPSTLSIAAVERDTGLSKDTLRIWERRYGFPEPARDASGERSYPVDQLEKLRVLKRLLDAGHRPGRVITLPLQTLQQLAQTGPAREAAYDSAGLDDQLDLIGSHDVPALRRALSRSLAQLGLARFVFEVAGPLITAVGDGWVRGRVQVFEEHLFTEVMQGVLRQAIAAVPESPEDGRPHVLLATLPGEPHGLGLLMAEALLALDGCRCTSLGTQAPLWDVAQAARALDVDIVALSFSGCIGPDQTVRNLTDLRSRLAPTVALWAGGSAPVLRRRQVNGVQPLSSLAAVPTALQGWHDEHESAAQTVVVPKMQA